MTFAKHLKTSVVGLGRTAFAAALGLGLAGAIAFQPVQAFAQAAQAPAAVAGRATPQAAGAGPALWVIRDADSTIYLFGTVHLLRPTTAWGSARIDAALASADELWLEVVNPDDQAVAAPLIQQFGFSPDRPLSSLLTAGELVALNAVAVEAGLSGTQIDPFRPWLAMLALSIAPITKAGYDPSSGVDLVLKARAVATGKPVKGFETLDKQIGILAGLPEADQLAGLRELIATYADAVALTDELVNAWATGDVATLERLVVTDMREQSQAMYDALLVQRNTDWAGQIQTLLAGSGTAFIAVGAGHLAGDESVQEILEDRGVKVETVQ